MLSHYFYTPIIAFLAGVGAQSLFAITLPAISWLFLLVGAIGIIALRECQQKRRVFFLIATSCFLLLGFLRMEIASWKFGVSGLADYVGTVVVLQGVVIHEPDIREQFQYLDVRTSDTVVRVSADVYQEVSYGDEILVEGTLEVPSSFVTELGREFHYNTYLRAKGIEYTLRAESFDVVSKENGSEIISVIFTLKHFLLAGIADSIREPEAGLGAGLLLGVKQALGDDIEQAFRASGIIHIVVLSGYNIMLIVAFVMSVLSFFLKRKTRTVVGLIAIVGFAVMVGLSATVVRASIMAGLLLIASAFGRTYDVTRALLFAGCVMVFLNPYLFLYDIGFQLSFMATLGLILFLPRFEALLASGQSLSLREYVLSTLATQIAVLPLLLYYMGEVSIVALIVNVLVLPIVPLAMLCTFFAGMLVHISFLLAVPFIFIAQYSLTYIISIAIWFAELPFATIQVPVFSPYLVPVLYMGMGFLYWYFKEDKNENKKDARVERASSSETPVFFR